MVKVYCVHDQKAEMYQLPQFYRRRGEALRSFEQAVKQKDHPFSLHPADYRLFEIGEYDEDTGKITSYKIPENCGCALDFVTGEFSAVPAERTQSPDERIQ